MGQIIQTDDQQKTLPTAVLQHSSFLKGMGGSVLLVLLSVDSLLLIAAGIAARLLSDAGWLGPEPGRSAFFHRLELMGIFVLFVITSFALLSAYDPSVRRNPRQDIVQVIGVVSLATIASGILVSLLALADYTVGQGALLWGASASFLVFGRLALGNTTKIAESPARLALVLAQADGGAKLDGNTPTDGVPQPRLTRFPWQYRRAKRTFDVVFTCISLAVAAPFMLIIAAAIKLDSRGPVLFKQARIGQHGQPFHMYKFRSMRQDAEDMLDTLRQQNEASGPIFKMRRDPRITRVGAIIRRTSLDELPQLFNVLQGTMSLVGPRPPLPEEVKAYEPRHRRRLEPVPGLTGLWQVNRSPDPSFDEMLDLDVAYIEHWSLALDLAIMLKTIPTVITARGAY